jgi:hypothetical protein
MIQVMLAVESVSRAFYIKDSKDNCKENEFLKAIWLDFTPEWILQQTTPFSAYTYQG